MFPSKDYNNESADEAAEELMKNFAEMKEAKNIANNMLTKAKAAGVPQADGLTHELLK